MSWIDDFISYTVNTTSPELFRRWAAISTIAMALERKVWAVTYGSALYPNLYVILVAPPGVGKSEVTWRCRDFLSRVDDLHIGASSLTKASMIDELNDAERRVVRPQDNPAVINFHSLSLIVDELGVLLPVYENDFMNTLTNLYDGQKYSEKRRTKNLVIEIAKPQVNMLAATTPAYLNNVMPEGAWDQGFISRTILIYTGDKQLRSLFEVQPTTATDLSDRLKDIAVLYGEMKFTEEAARLLDTWHLDGGQPAPEHPKLMYYNSRRTAHLIKLCQIAAADARQELIIRAEDFRRALDWLIEAEFHMPEIFKAMGTGGAGKTMDEAWYYLFTIFTKEGQPVAEHRLIQFLQEKVPVHQIAVTIEMMEKGRLINKTLTKTGNAYTPKGRQADV